jgi:hypothetical protein
MSKLTICIENHDQKYTVSEMRRRLAQVLSKLSGDQEVSFSFVATLENYKPAARVFAKSAILGAPYTFDVPPNATVHQIEAETNTPIRDGLWGYARSVSSEPLVIFGELAQPEND